MKRIFNMLIIRSVVVLVLLPVALMLQSYTVSSTGRTHTGSDSSFSYHYEIYKSAVVLMWNQRPDSIYIEVNSKDGHRTFFSTSSVAGTTMRRTFVIPLEHFKLEDYPISASMKFFGHDFTITDNLTISL